MSVRRSSPPSSVIAWPGSNTKGISALANCAACSSMPRWLSGATIPSVMPALRGTSFRWARFMAPGWKAVIWLLAASVVMYACAVYSSASSLTKSVDRPLFCIHAR